MKYPKKILKKTVDTWLFIVNSTAGQGKTGKKINTLVNTLNRHKFDFEIELTKAPKHATKIASGTGQGWRVMKVTKAYDAEDGFGIAKIFIR